MTGANVAELRRRTLAELRERMAAVSRRRRSMISRDVRRAGMDEASQWEASFEEWNQP